MARLIPSTGEIVTNPTAYCLQNGDRISGAQLLAVIDDYGSQLSLDGRPQGVFDRSVLSMLLDDEGVADFHKEKFTCEFWTHSDPYGSGRGVRFHNWNENAPKTQQVVMVDIGDPPRYHDMVAVGPAVGALPGLPMTGREADVMEDLANLRTTRDHQAFFDHARGLVASHHRRELDAIAQQARPDCTQNSDLASPDEALARRSSGRRM